MKSLKGSILLLFLGLLSAGLFSNAHAQTKADVIKSYNKAFDYAKSNDYQKAITAYVQTIDMADKVGSEAADIKEKAESKLPALHFRLSAQHYKEFKNQQNLEQLNDAIDSFTETVDVAKKYNNSDIASRAQSIVPKLFYTKSIYLFKTSKYQESLDALDQAINIDPKYAKAYYQKGIVMKNMDKGNWEKAIDMFDKAIQVGLSANDQQIVSKAENAAREELVYQGAQATKDKHYKDAVKILNRALDYDAKSPNAYYRLAEAYNKQAMWNQALNSADKALKYEKGGKTDLAKIYFEKGTALKGLGNKSAACSAFEQAAYGSFKASAEHQMEYELKCKQLSQSTN